MLGVIEWIIRQGNFGVPWLKTDLTVNNWDFLINSNWSSIYSAQHVNKLSVYIFDKPAKVEKNLSGATKLRTLTHPCAPLRTLNAPLRTLIKKDKKHVSKHFKKFQKYFLKSAFSHGQSWTWSFFQHFSKNFESCSEWPETHFEQVKTWVRRGA